MIDTRISGHELHWGWITPPDTFTASDRDAYRERSILRQPAIHAQITAHIEFRPNGQVTIGPDEKPAGHIAYIDNPYILLAWRRWLFGDSDLKVTQAFTSEQRFCGPHVEDPPRSPGNRYSGSLAGAEGKRSSTEHSVSAANPRTGIT